jgi:para-aminobenzoate synthetase / 4-amino-4-deoxychorismate lyase
MEDTLQLQPGDAWFGGAFHRGQAGEALLFLDPVETLVLHSGDDVEGYLAELQDRLDQGFSLAGYAGYEMGYGLDPALRPLFLRSQDTGVPLAWFGVYAHPRHIRQEPGDGQSVQDRPFSGLPRFDCSPERYREKIGLIRQAIGSGEVYQVNLTGRFTFGYSGNPHGLFRRLSRRQPDAYRAFLNCGDHQVLSFSPELFFSVHGTCIETAPMKGTSPRGMTAAEDIDYKSSLAACSKNRAENLMIVDLLRNDLGRICEPGSVHVPELFVTRSYPTLHQMISTIRGRLRKDCTVLELFKALFPCGSVTGAPKISAMRLITRLEDSPRGVYTGAVGFMLPDGRKEFNVAIRTLTMRGGEAVYGAGSGIVWDSTADKEYAECRLKAEILFDRPASRPSELFETLLWNCRYVWREMHLDRLCRSASELGFTCDRGALEEALERHASEKLVPCRQPARVRLSLSGDNRISVTSGFPGSRAFDSPVRVCLSPVTTDSSDILLRHKSSQRRLYDSMLEDAVSQGFDEVIFCNERNEVTEGAISNIIVLKTGRYYTPPLSSGLLPGIYRHYFLSTRLNVREKVLYPCDLFEADALYVCNSVRGLRRALLQSSSLLRHRGVDPKS